MRMMTGIPHSLVICSPAPSHADARALPAAVTPPQWSNATKSQPDPDLPRIAPFAGDHSPCCPLPPDVGQTLLLVAGHACAKSADNACLSPTKAFCRGAM